MNFINRQMDRIEEKGIDGALLVMGIILFTPAFPMPGRLPAVRIEEILIPVMLLFLWQRRKTALSVIRQPMTILLALLGAAMAVSTVNAVAFQGARLAFGDLM